jgi:(2Fe-2S) ferredoxin
MVDLPTAETFVRPFGSDTSKAVLTLERTWCLGECPAYAVVLYPDGRLLYRGVRFVEEDGFHESHVAKDSVECRFTLTGKPL